MLAVFRKHEFRASRIAAPGGADKPSLATIDKLVFLVSPVGYQWPASALTGFDMQRLTGDPGCNEKADH